MSSEHSCLHILFWYLSYLLWISSINRCLFLLCYWSSLVSSFPFSPLVSLLSPFPLLSRPWQSTDTDRAMEIQPSQLKSRSFWCTDSHRVYLFLLFKGEMIPEFCQPANHHQCSFTTTGGCALLVQHSHRYTGTRVLWKANCLYRGFAVSVGFSIES